MAPNLTAGRFKIVSLVSDPNPPTSVNLTLPAWQQVYLNGPVTVWSIRKEGSDSYRLSIGGYGYTSVMDDKVNATIYAEENVEWYATYHEYQNAYTIEPVDDRSKGWTVLDKSEHSAVGIQLIISTMSDPPQYTTTQLFRFVPLVGDEGEAEA